MRSRRWTYGSATLIALVGVLFAGAAGFSASAGARAAHSRAVSAGSRGAHAGPARQRTDITPAGHVAGRARVAGHVRALALLSLPRGTFQVSLGRPPAWLPLAGVPETLTLLSGPPRLPHPRSDNAYVGFTAPGRACAATPAASRGAVLTVPRFYAPARSAARDAGVLAPGGGAARGTFVASVPGVRLRGSGAVRACVWIAPPPGAQARRGRPSARSLRASILVPLLNHRFAASVSNLAGSGSGGYVMDAFAGGRRFRWSASTRQCTVTSTDPSTVVAAATVLSETVAIASSPCTTDQSTFTFTGAGLHATLTYTAADALADPALSVGVGDCELDPVTGATLQAAVGYLSAVGCRLGRVEAARYSRGLRRGLVSWAAVSGGVADLAPRGTAVDLVLNG